MYSPHNTKLEEFIKHQEDILPFTSKYIGETNLDIGCGNGLTSVIHQRELKINPTLSDITDIRDDLAKGLPFKKIIGSNLPFDDKKFSSSYIQYIFHHLPTQEAVISLINECKRVSKRVILVEEVAGEQTNIEKAMEFDSKINSEIYPGNDMTVYQYFTLRQITEFFRLSGMGVIDHEIISKGDGDNGYLETHAFIVE